MRLLEICSKEYSVGNCAANNIYDMWTRDIYVQEPPRNVYVQFMDALHRYQYISTRVDNFDLDLSQPLQSKYSVRINSYLMLNFKGTPCPACTPASSSDKDIIFLFMDGNFSAKRYKRTTVEGEKLFRSYISTPLQDDGDDIKDQVGSCCANHLAGKDRTGDERCDINGLFGSVCPHGIPFVFYDIEKGEKYNLGRSVLDEFYSVTPNTRLVLGYDIVCKFEKSMVRISFNC